MTDDTDLKLADIPHEDADIDEICKFAGAINGYTIAGSFERCAAIARNPDQDSIIELRICLFFNFRAMRHTGGWDTDDDFKYIREIVKRIRDLAVK